jgi:basic amino acid/polyamine antiporter, APA family
MEAGRLACDSRGRNRTSQEHSAIATTLHRVVTLPMLVLYGVGVTVGAGIFVLIGTVGELAGPRAPLAFVLAAIIATATAFSYAALARGFPHAAGASLYVHRAFGPMAGLVVGFGVALTGIVSSATITLGFTGYLLQLADLPRGAVVVVTLVFVGWLVARGVRESVGAAAAMTAIEIAVLVALIGAGAPILADPSVWIGAFGLAGPFDAQAILAAAVLAFFAFIGFEDIVNMAEETVDPERAVARAILATLGITTLLYVLVALVAAGAPPAQDAAPSDAPLAALWTRLTGMSGAWLAALALVSVLNGVIVQVIMASRLLYGMARERMLPAFLGHVGARHTPVAAVWIVASAIVVLALAFPIATLARLTTTVTLIVFASVNVALVVLAARPDHERLRPWRPAGILGAVLTGGLAAYEIARALIL